MARASLILLLCFLASCSRQSDEHSSTTAQNATPAPASTSDESHEAESAPSKLFFTGRWASEVANCGNAWVITADELRTPGEVTCRFHQVTPTSRGAEVDATCFAEGPPQEWKLQFAYAESARALLIEDAPFSDIGLVRCDDEAASAGNDESTAKTARGAADVLNKYYELLNTGRIDEAARLWTSTERAGEQNVASYQSRDIHLGEPGRIEGAAGSLYISIPVQIDAKSQSGEAENLSGEATLRRSNDVPGSTPEQRYWRIDRIELRPAAKN